jgi:thiol-disulfide isomerase/thioredoxin
MDAAESLEELLATNVLVETDVGISTTSAFQEAVETEVDRIRSDGDAIVDRIDATTSDGRETERIHAAGAVDETFLALYLTLADRLDSRPAAAVCDVAVVLQGMQDGIPPSHGVPDPLRPVRGDQLTTLWELSPVAILYVWLDDCDPCDAMRAAFEMVLAGHPAEDLGLYAVYGPDWAELLYEEYNVAGGPTTLFVADGTVNARLHGEYSAAALRTELDTFRSLVLE